MGKLWLFSNFQYLGILSNMWDSVQKMMGTGDYDATKIQNAYQTLDNVRPYLHFNDAVGQVFNWVKWGILKFLYTLADGAQRISTEAFDYRELLTSAGLKEQYQGYIVAAAAAVMTAMLIWIGVKYMLGKEQQPIQNVVMQVIISVFLIFNISTITNWCVEQATGFYSAAVSEKNGSKYSNSIPFDLVAKNTNDLMYMYYTNWKGYGTKDSGKIKTQYREHFGNNGWVENGKPTDAGQDAFEQLSANDLAMSITPDQAGTMQKELDKIAKKNGWATEKVRPEYLKYRLIDGGDRAAAVKIGKSNIPFSNAFSGGYSRYTVAALPVAFCLACLAFSFFFITYLIIKTFLDLAIMQIISVVVFSSDLDSGAKTKAVCQDIFTSCITLCVQAVELMFYRIVADWIIAQDFQSKGITGLVIECMGMLAASAMLIAGSQKTTKFFGVDTGAQKGWTMGALALNQTAGLVKKTAGAAAGTVKVAKGTAKGAYNFATDTAARANALGKGFDRSSEALRNRRNEATNGGAPMKLSDYKNAVTSGFHGYKGEMDTRKEFLGNGGSRTGWIRGQMNGEVDKASAAKAQRLDDNGGLRDNEFDSLRRQTEPQPNVAVREYADKQAEGTSSSSRPYYEAQADKRQAQQEHQQIDNRQNGSEQAASAAQNRKLSDAKVDNPVSHKEVERRLASDDNRKLSDQVPVAKSHQSSETPKSETKKTPNAEAEKPMETRKISEKPVSTQAASTSTSSPKTNTNPGTATRTNGHVNKSGETKPVSQGSSSESRKISDGVTNPVTTSNSESKQVAKTVDSSRPAVKPASAPQTTNTIAREKGNTTQVKVHKSPDEIKRTITNDGNTKISETRNIAKGRSIADVTHGKQVIRNKDITQQGDKTNIRVRRSNEINRSIDDVTKVKEDIKHSVDKHIKEAPKHGDFKSGKDN